MSKPLEYLCQIDSGIIPGLDTAWTLTSPNATEWQLTISTAGIITTTSGATTLGDADVLGVNGSLSSLSISNGGVITITTLGTPVTSADTVAALVDSNTITWLFLHLLDGQLLVTTEKPLENKYYYPAIVISFEVTHELDKFELYAVKPNTSMHRR